MTRKIVARYENPPIPVRAWDYCAHYEGEEEHGRYGWGHTADEAIKDFRDNCQEWHDARLAAWESKP